MPSTPRVPPDSERGLDNGNLRTSEEAKINELDPLYSANNEDLSDSDNDDYGADAPLRRRKRREVPRSRIQSRAYSAHRQSSILKLKRLGRSIGWLCTRRTIFATVLVIAFGVILVVLSGGFWVYKKSKIDGASPPWYPSPKGGTMNRWAESYDRASRLVKQMTLAEKVNITTGTGWEMGMCVGNTGPAIYAGFPSLCLQDGPLGLRFADNVSAGPAGITVGATWNRDLMYKRGRMLGQEARAKGINVLLGPSVGPLGRVPAGGRNWEGFGIDPVLQGIAAAATVEGIQEEGVMATIKHFVGNEQEHFRQAWEWGLPDAISSNLDDRTLHELYAWPFADAIRAGVSSVMCSYNQVNNSYACQNSKLLNGIIKDEMGFQGFIQSDWLAQRSGVASALSGLDMSMPGDGLRWADGKALWGSQLSLAILNGSVPVERLDDMVTRIVAAWYQIGQDDPKIWPRVSADGTGSPNFSSWTNDRIGLLHPGSDDETTGVVNYWVDAKNQGEFSHAALVRRIAAEGIVLLKNNDGILPLARSGWPQLDEQEYDIDLQGEKIHYGVYGEDAVLPEGGPNVCVDRGCNRGTLAMGWGSGAADFPYLVSPWAALLQGFKQKTVELSLHPSNDLPRKNQANSPEDQDFCIIFVNADGGEGFIASDGINGDRNDLEIQKGGLKLIQDVTSRCGKNLGARSTMRKAKRATRGNTIVVIHSVGPVLMESFIENANIASVLYANLPGQESGAALADVIFGRVNPSGHLPYTIGKAAADYGPGSELIYYPNAVVPQQNFTEGLLVDYRWFDAMRLMPRFEFGFGLSYTKYSLSNLQITTKSDERPEALPAERPRDETTPPTYDKRIPSVDEAIWPYGLRELKKFIYPYIENHEDVYPDPSPEYLHFPVEGPGQAGGGEGGNPALYEELVQVEVDVTNEGERSGQAVVQLYVVFPTSAYEAEDAAPEAGIAARDADTLDERLGFNAVRQYMPAERISFPPRVLRGFQKLHLRGSISYSSPGSKVETRESHAQEEDTSGRAAHLDAHKKASKGHPERDEGLQKRSPEIRNQVGQKKIQYATGEKQTVVFYLTRRDISYWSAKRQNWVVPEGSFGIELGFSSRDIQSRGKVF